jgi:hypothetical protein
MSAVVSHITVSKLDPSVEKNTRDRRSTATRNTTSSEVIPVRHEAW